MKFLLGCSLDTYVFADFRIYLSVLCCITWLDFDLAGMPQPSLAHCGLAARVDVQSARTAYAEALRRTIAPANEKNYF